MTKVITFVETMPIENGGHRQQWSSSDVTLVGRSHNALPAAPYARSVKSTIEDRTAAQLMAEELTRNGFPSTYGTLNQLVPDGTGRHQLPDRSEWRRGAARPADASRVRARSPHSTRDLGNHVVVKDVVSNGSQENRIARCITWWWSPASWQGRASPAKCASPEGAGSCSQSRSAVR